MSGLALLLTVGLDALPLLVAAGPSVGPVQLAELTLAAGLVVGLSSVVRARRRRHPLRIAVIGSGPAATWLRAELEFAHTTRYEVVGRIPLAPVACPAPDDRPVMTSVADLRGGNRVLDDPPVIGRLADLRTAVERHDIDLLLMGVDAPRMQIFEALLKFNRQPARVCELSAFYEEVFGHVPIAAINAAWFQYLMHPRFTPPRTTVKRGFDIAASLVVGLIFLPVLLVAALLIRRDGGPALYRQTRVGDGGRLFTIYKLRTMRVDPPGPSSWSSHDDSRVTPIGRVLRVTHLDELPQLLNILAGEMSIVGPRPEQPHYVAELETEVPFYTGRHMVKPGLTGLAQVRCGYAGSSLGTKWKLCHDLYYIKHQSIGLDVRILWNTVWTLSGRGQYGEVRELPFVLPPTHDAQSGAAAASSGSLRAELGAVAELA